MSQHRNQDPSALPSQPDTLRTLQEGTSVEFSDGMIATVVDAPGAVIDMDTLRLNPVTLNVPAIVITEKGHYATDTEVLTSLPALEKTTGQFGTDTDRLLAARFDSGKIGNAEPLTLGQPWANIAHLTKGEDNSRVVQMVFGPGAKTLETTTAPTPPKHTNLPSPFESASRHVERASKALPKKIGQVATY